MYLVFGQPSNLRQNEEIPKLSLCVGGGIDVKRYSI